MIRRSPRSRALAGKPTLRTDVSARTAPAGGILGAFFRIPLWKRVIAGLVSGALLGLCWPDAAPPVAILGEIFVRLIRMLVVPIVLVTIAAGITSLADPGRLGSLGGRTILLFMATTAIAVAVGMLVAIAIEPGTATELGPAGPAPLAPAISVREQLIGIVPLNIFAALADGNMLAVIFIAVLLGIGTVVAGASGAPVAAFLNSASSVLLHVVRLAMELTPFGVFALIANAIADHGAAMFVSVGWLALSVLVGSLIQVLVVHSVLIALVARLPVVPFFRGIFDALVVAFSTASSSATLPVALRVAQDDLGIARPVASTVLPLGATIGKDGTAMYVGLLAVFSLQALDVPIDAATLLVIFLTAGLAAFGTAPVPSASLFMLAAVLSAVGVGPAQTALVVALVLPFDRLLDMTRTVPSASANLAVATTVARWEAEIDLHRYAIDT